MEQPVNKDTMTTLPEVIRSRNTRTASRDEIRDFCLYADAQYS
jgi:hypothetical protein